jgi:hypothetical protein
MVRGAGAVWGCGVCATCVRCEACRVRRVVCGVSCVACEVCAHSECGAQRVGVHNAPPPHTHTF